MLAYVFRRLLHSVPVLLLASVIVFFGVSAVGDPLGTLRVTPGISEQALQRIIEREGLDDPIAMRYLSWLGAAVTSGFGDHLLSSRPIWPNLSRALLNTMQLILLAEMVAIAVATTLGVLSARRQYSSVDYATTVISFLGISIPAFWFALVLQVAVTNLYAATGVRLFYTFGGSSPDVSGGLMFVVDRLQHLALPVMALSFVFIAQYVRYIRSSMLEVLHADYVRTARSKGASERRVVLGHALRNAIIPVITVFALDFGALIGGAIIIESVFGLDGMGRFFITALTNRDTNAIMAWLMVSGIAVVSMNLVADIAYGYLDPRIRL